MTGNSSADKPTLRTMRTGTAFAQTNAFTCTSRMINSRLLTSRRGLRSTKTAIILFTPKHVLHAPFQSFVWDRSLIPPLLPLSLPPGSFLTPSLHQSDTTPQLLSVSIPCRCRPDWKCWCSMMIRNIINFPKRCWRLLLCIFLITHKKNYKINIFGQNTSEI